MRESSKLGLDRDQVFKKVQGLVLEARGESAMVPRAMRPLVGRCTIPYFTEPWYCCAEPTSEQLAVVNVPVQAGYLQTVSFTAPAWASVRRKRFGGGKHCLRCWWEGLFSPAIGNKKGPGPRSCGQLGNSKAESLRRQGSVLRRPFGPFVSRLL